MAFKAPLTELSSRKYDYKLARCVRGVVPCVGVLRETLLCSVLSDGIEYICIMEFHTLQSL